jgi:hypothetical protein
VKQNLKTESLKTEIDTIFFHNKQTHKQASKTTFCFLEGFFDHWQIVLGERQIGELLPLVVGRLLQRHRAVNKNKTKQNKNKNKHKQDLLYCFYNSNNIKTNKISYIVSKTTTSQHNQNQSPIKARFFKTITSQHNQKHSHSTQRFCYEQLQNKSQSHLSLHAKRCCYRGGNFGSNVESVQINCKLEFAIIVRTNSKSSFL